MQARNGSDVLRGMQKPPHRSWLFWIGPAVFGLLGLLMADSCFHMTDMRIPRGEKVPANLYVIAGVVHLDLKETADPYYRKAFVFGRHSMSRRPRFTARFYERWDGVELPDPRGPLAEAEPVRGHKLAVPIWMPMTVIGGVWGIAVMRRSRRMVREAMAMQAG